MWDERGTMEPSKAALRAAKAILGNYTITAKADGAQLYSHGLAKIIETETHTTECVETLRNALNELRAVFSYGMAAVDANRFWPAMTKARELLETLTQETQ